MTPDSRTTPVLHDPAALTAALDALAARDACLARALDDVGAPEPRMRPAGFGSLLRIIVDQQVSTAAGAAIWARVAERFGAEPDPAALAAAPDADLAGCGLSRPKQRYARALGVAVTEGGLDLDALARQPDAAVREALLPLPGIGPWTIDIYLMFALGRPDVFPAGDLALQAACHGLYGLEARPGPREAEALAEPWRPWRGAAAILLWRWYGLRMKGRAGAGTPLQGA